jgi:hypothetical protein
MYASPFPINLGYRKWGIWLLHMGIVETPLCNQIRPWVVGP